MAQPNEDRLPVIALLLLRNPDDSPFEFGADCEVYCGVIIGATRVAEASLHTRRRCCSRGAAHSLYSHDETTKYR